ncbi:MAG: xanthine dehydrogenase family protein molybdopterin-binding subunit [Bacteroidetes bacterium]|nr:xanthine dehydrogenase family protein molybdopterin-binding subunit [Bacteroidota bacterium]
MKEEKINEIYFNDINEPIKFNRRDFIKRLGGGLIIVFSLSELSFIKGFEDTVAGDEPDFNAYLRVTEDGRVDLYTGKIEMGQGIITSLGQVLADELEVPLNLVDVIMGDTELCPYDAGTWGSLTTRFFDPPLRAAGAQAKAELIKLGAKSLNLPAKQIIAEEGFIVNTKNKEEKVSYASLTRGKKIVKTISNKISPKQPSEFKKTGNPILSTDSLEKVTGKAKYAADIQLPGMLYAYIKRPPAHGSILTSVDTSSAEEMEGVQIVKDGDLVAVLHENPNVAEQALARVRLEWEIPPVKANDKTIFSYILENAKNEKEIENKGDVVAGNELANEIIEEVYFDGYKAHASIETHTATVKIEGDKLTMWASTQTPFGTREQVAKELDMPLEKVHIKQIFLGGGYGGKIYNQQAVEAARIAKLSGKPIQLAWSRREEFMYDRFRPAAVVKISSGVKKSGEITSWNYNVFCAGARGANVFYNIPNIKSVSSDGKDVHPFGTGAWRAPANNTNTFARESQIDRLAHKIEIDPLEFRLKNLKDEQMINTLKAAAEKFGYTGTKTSEGSGTGIALGMDAGTYVVIIAEVKVDKSSGEVQPIRIVCAQDMGQVVNPHGAAVQCEGGITMGLGYALYEDIEFNWGEVKNRNFDTYEFTRFSVTPKIETVFIDDMESAPQGGGEPAIICVGGAIANAVFNACGARVNQMPITPEKILNVLTQ